MPILGKADRLLVVEYEKNPDTAMMVPLPVVEGERIRCVVNTWYAEHSARRLPEIDWALVRELQWMVRRLLGTRLIDWYVHELHLHFDDALDSSLPESRRMIHADIAFARMWAAFGPEPSMQGYPRLDERFVGMALEAGLT